MHPMRRTLGIVLATASMLLLSQQSLANSRDQAQRIHNRLAGVPADAATLTEMTALIDNNNAQAAAELAMEFLAFMRNGEGNHEFEAKFRLTLVDKTESDPGMWTSGEVKHEIQDHKTLDAFDISPMRDERRFYALQCTFMVVADHQTVQVSEQLPLRIVVGDGEVMP